MDKNICINHENVYEDQIKLKILKEKFTNEINKIENNIEFICINDCINQQPSVDMYHIYKYFSTISPLELLQDIQYLVLSDVFEKNYIIGP